MPLKRSATKIDFIKKNKERLAQTKQRSHSSQPLLKSSLKSPKFPTKSQNSLKSSISKNEFLNYSQNRGRHLKPSDKKPQKSSFAAEDLTKKTPLHMQVTREATLSEEVDETKSTNKDAKPSISFINISNDTEMQLESPDHVPIIIYDFSDSKSFIDDKENINPEDLTYKRGKKSIIVIEVDENMEIKHYQPDVIYSYKFESLCKPVNWILEDEERRVSIEIFENRWSLDERQQARDHLLLITASIKKQSTEKSEVKIIDYPHIQLEYMSQKTSLDSSYQATPVKSQFSN